LLLGANIRKVSQIKGVSEEKVQNIWNIHDPHIEFAAPKWPSSHGIRRSQMVDKQAIKQEE
jgi:hypothetical protein